MPRAELWNKGGGVWREGGMGKGEWEEGEGEGEGGAGWWGGGVEGGAEC